MKNTLTKIKLIWKIIGAFVLLLCIAGGAYLWDIKQEQKVVNALSITRQDMSIHDGTYYGYYQYGRITYGVDVTIKNYAITDIQVVSNRTNKYARMAEGVIKNVLARNNVDVDVIAGATTTSKALLKAIEQVLACNL